MKDICHIPVVGHMTIGPDGQYHLDEESSTWADIPASLIAEYLVSKFGIDNILGEGDSGGSCG